MCLIAGGTVTALAPLWMRCSVVTTAMQIAGPGTNLIIALLALAALRSVPRNRPALGLWLWLTVAFNLLVACGYLMVGGLTTFGDWGAIFAGTMPSYLWRVPAVVIGFAGYLAGLWIADRSYRRLFGLAAIDAPCVRDRTLLPAAGAAAVAIAAELIAAHFQPEPIATKILLPLACALVPGITLWRRIASDAALSQSDGKSLSIKGSPALYGLAAVVAIFFVAVVGSTGIHFG